MMRTGVFLAALPAVTAKMRQDLPASSASVQSPDT